MPIRITFAALLVAGLLVAGCGGDDDETTTTDTTAETGATGASGASGESGQAAGGGLLPDDFAADANAVCVAGNEELDAAGAELFGGGSQPSKAEQEEFVSDALVPSIEGQIAAIRALGEPDEGADELSAALDDADSAVQEVKDDPSLLTGNGDPFAGLNDQFAELGLPACAD